MTWITPVVYLSIYIGLIATTFYILNYMNYRKKERKFFSEEELPSVSIIIPAWNEEKSIEKTLKSVIDFDYPKDRFEIIVVDDGSEDETYKLAKKYENKGIEVFTKKNGGKGSALNLGISKAKGEIIFTMDADTIVNPDCVKKMVQPFTNPRVMGVTPAMLVYRHKNILERIQQMEYFMGVFLRKAFATLNAVYITPGAFSCYRKEFFDKHGGYDENNVTEDIEISLRMQYNGYFIDNCPDAAVHTLVPKTFKSLLIQRRRWYFGYLKNIFKYRGLINKKYGDLGLFIIPVGLFSIVASILIMIYLISESAINIYDEVAFLIANNFSHNFFSFGSFFFEKLIYSVLTSPIFLSLFFFVSVMGFYLYWASKKVGKVNGLGINLFFFFAFFAFLFSFWWIVSIIYVSFSKTVKWR